MTEQQIDQLLEERDAAEESLSTAYLLVIGESPEWSNLFGQEDALYAIEEKIDEYEFNQRELIDICKSLKKELWWQCNAQLVFNQDLNLKPIEELLDKAEKVLTKFKKDE